MGTPESTRGAGYVAVQGVLITLVIVGPRRIFGWPGWAFPEDPVVLAAGAALLLAGAVLLAAGGAKHGLRLSVLPRPVEGAKLIQTGVYRLVRHPMYLGVATMAFGWGLLRRGWLTLLFAALLLLWLDVKARREERWLLERFPEYADYQRRVRRIIPFP